MPSFSDSIFLFVLALLLFGPKKLPKLARELGKWVGEFRRASNEFKFQMEEELRIAEQQERTQKIAAMEAAAPPRVEPAAEVSEPEHPHTQPAEPVTEVSSEPAGEPAPVPIATAGDIKMMPPATGLPSPRGSSSVAAAFDNIPPASTAEETAANG